MADDKADLARNFKFRLEREKRAAFARQIALNVIGILLFFAAWEVLPRIIPGVNLLMFPPPSGIVDAFAQLLRSGELFEDAAVSVGRAVGGFLIGGSAGIVMGLLTARVLLLRHVSEPVLHGLRSVPSIALVPLAIIWFGIGETSKIALITWGAFFPVWINTFLGARDVSAVFVRSAESLGCRGWRMLFRIILPAALPLILAGLRQALTVALIIMVAAELIGARNGLGQLISSSHQLFRVDYMFVGLMALGAIGFCMDRIFATLVDRLFPWYGRT
jgi:ABC-type nitrate/sulfonate/bicarbonate transport system permease component